MLAQTSRPRSCNRVHADKLSLSVHMLVCCNTDDQSTYKAPNGKVDCCCLIIIHAISHGLYNFSICQHLKISQSAAPLGPYTRASKTSVLLHAMHCQKQHVGPWFMSCLAHDKETELSSARRQVPAGATHRCRQRMSSSRTCRFSARRRLRTTVELRRCSPALRRPPCRKGSTARSGTCSTRNAVDAVLVNCMLGKTSVLLYWYCQKR